MSRPDSMSNCKEILICSIPNHIGVEENERADSAAKLALDLTPNINNIHNKLFQIQPTLGEWRPPLRKSRREQVIIFDYAMVIQGLLTLSY